MCQTQTSYPQAVPPIRCCCLSDTAAVKPSFNQTTNSRGVNGEHLAPNTFSPHTHQDAGRDLNPVTHRLTATSDSSSAALKEAGDLAGHRKLPWITQLPGKPAKGEDAEEKGPIAEEEQLEASRQEIAESKELTVKHLSARTWNSTSNSRGPGTARTWNSRVQGSGTALETAECKDPKQQSARTQNSRVQGTKTAECKDLKQRLIQQSARTWNSRVQGPETALETAECKDLKQHLKHHSART